MEYETNDEILKDLMDQLHTLHKENARLIQENEFLNSHNKHEAFVGVGVGDGTGNKFVYGTYESIKKVQEFILENEKLKTENQELNRKLKSIQALFL
jgi:regulator of replication initiation timing